MSNLDTLKRKVNELNVLADKIVVMGVEIIQRSSIAGQTRSGHLVWDTFTTEVRSLQREVIPIYQSWYNVGYQLIKEYLPDKVNEFVDSYQTQGMYKHGVFDYLQLRNGTENKDKNRIITHFIDALETQRSIVLSIPDVAEIKELNLRKIISADIARTEIEQAEILLASGYERAAGSIAGVALELHLRTLCDVNGVNYALKDTIDPLATALYKAGILDITELKRIQFLASIRNKCSHPNPISPIEIKDLIEDVKKLI